MKKLIKLENPLEKAMATHSSILAWKIPRTEEPGRLQSMGSQRVGHDWMTSLSLFTFMHWRRKWQPTPVFLPGEPQDGRAWWAAFYGVTQSRTRLKWLSSSRRSEEPLVSPPLFTVGWGSLYLLCFSGRLDSLDLQYLTGRVGEECLTDLELSLRFCF